MFRRLAVSALLLAGTLISPARPSHAAPALTPVSIALNWLTNVEFGGIWVAQQKGWWQQAGLQVDVRGYDFNSDPVVLVGAGKYTFGFQDGASLIIARAKAGIPLKAIYASVQQSPFAFMSLPKSGIKAVADFKGKRIGYQAHEKYVLESMLNHAGLTIKDVTPVVVGFDPTILLAGKVDAFLCFQNNEPIQLLQKYKIRVNIVKASDYGYNFYADVMFTTDSTIKADPTLVKKVVQVMDRGWRYAVAHPAETAKIVVPAIDKADSVAQQTAEMTAMVTLAQHGGGALGGMDAARWQNGIGLLQKYGQIPATMQASDVFTTLFLPAQ